MVAFYASAGGLQLGPGVEVIAFTSVAANLAAITGGILVFRDPIGVGAPAIVLRMIALTFQATGATIKRMLKGFPGKPLHPPLTDASIGSYTLGVAALVAGKAGLQPSQMAHAALIAISFGLIVAAPTALTGLLDWLDIENGTPARRVATIHLLLMVTTTLLFAITWLLQRPGYNADEVRTGGLIAGLVAFGFLAVGSNIGGANVFVYGIRVLGRRDVPPAKALNPLGVESAEPRSSEPDRPT